MDIVNAMRVFVRVVELGSFTAASDDLECSTAHVSRSITNLEKHLRARLINRSTRSMVVTEVGTRFLLRCRSILGDLKAAESEAAGAQREAFGMLRIHAPIGLGHYHITPLITQYTKEHSKVDFELTLGQTVIDPVANGYDLMIASQVSIRDSSLVSQALGTTCSILCAGPAYLAEKGIPRTLADLRKHDCLQMEDPGFPSEWLLEEQMVPSIAPLRQKLTVNVAEGIAQAAKENMGVALLPLYVAAGAISRGELVRVLPHLRAHDRTISVIYPSRHFLDAKVRTFVEYLKLNCAGRLEADAQAISQ